jgi:hypothetical protein
MRMRLVTQYLVTQYLVTQHKGKTFPLAYGAARIFCNVFNFDQTLLGAI